MNAELVGLITFGLLVAAIAAGMQVSEDRLSVNTKDTVKLAASLVATLAALVLGLLVSSAKASYDTARSEVIDISAKIVFLDRVLAGYGPETAEARSHLRETAEESMYRMWSTESKRPVNLALSKEAGNALYMAIHSLTPKD